MRTLLWLLPLGLGLMGCQANTDSIEQFIAKTHTNAKAKVKPLAAPYIFVAESFVMTSKRVPFLRPRPELLLAKQANSSCWQPLNDHQPTQLETFPLEQLSMKGAIGHQRQLWGLIYTPKGELVKIKPGQFVGLNRGKVIKVSDKLIEIEETLPDGKGCWLTRPAKLALVQH
ncbi:pilus assembly protein PilQ [Photobacterium iliopiscarium]|jgi:type IV pilus assembly protein PilP|uniref:Pilus assembly protein PilQ n=1 Tax=Photobacterium iliopiscarium TaxID=56192 RepID=A0A0D8Q319_9GAMM|nr:pilus assembly protein PilP [Photobacterium iliopiscarium]KJG14083.1 pilus assembly protein PilQ [Photobacterium iliopiscarium]KJG25556.1 pilus assembly protein PilQ [Photobacterium iliopiscarium]MCD9466210.1 pilus assembly protein PilQ [Photobacterium iliopiscarium]MCD9485805.1 pilus assembly protein PilQ [Photobacterium iliopiscarium]MCF2242502.1 pilus assembly protein PilQ [Photobacterium iliopiscarium]